MEPEILSEEQIEWETRRIRRECGSQSRKLPQVRFGGTDHPWIFFRYGPQGGKVLTAVLSGKYPPKVSITWGNLHLSSASALIDKRTNKGHALAPEMARVLFKLGHDLSFIEEHFDTLSAHERLELRLSLPREFWPKKWLDEENEK